MIRLATVSSSWVPKKISRSVEQAGPDVEGPLARGGLFDDGGDEQAHGASGVGREGTCNWSVANLADPTAGSQPMGCGFGTTTAGWAPADQEDAMDPLHDHPLGPHRRRHRRRLGLGRRRRGPGAWLGATVDVDWSRARRASSSTTTAPPAAWWSPRWPRATASASCGGTTSGPTTRRRSPIAVEPTATGRWSPSPRPSIRGQPAAGGLAGRRARGARGTSTTSRPAGTTASPAGRAAAPALVGVGA